VKRGLIITEIAIATLGVFALFAMGLGWAGLILMVLAAAGAATWATQRVR